MTEIQPFTFPTTGQPVRTISIDGEPWWFASDVCAVLDIANVGNALSRLEADDISSIRLADGTPGNPNRAVVNESALYELVIRSDRPQAKPFRRWVTAEVIPSIRKTGTYSASAALGDPLDELEQANVRLGKALWIARAEQKRAELAEQQVAALEPAANAWNTMATANGDFSVADAAKLLSRDAGITTGRDRLFTILHEFGWTYRQQSDRRWRPMQSAIETGRLTELAASHYHPRTGELVLDPPQVRITVKGIEALHKMLGGQTSVDALVGQ